MSNTPRVLEFKALWACEDYTPDVPPIGIEPKSRIDFHLSPQHPDLEVEWLQRHLVVLILLARYDYVNRRHVLT